MDETRFLIVGAGITGLAFANFVDSRDLLILERDAEIGGYCKTVAQDGFVWDYSGHFFHFRHPEIEAYLRARMPSQEIRTVEKVAKISYKGALIDFPFQKNIHQLPNDEFLDCLYHLVLREELPVHSFRDMVYSRFGRGIAERFLIPYNEKLYACDLADLDAGAMGRFFPYANLEEIVRNFKEPDNRSYNSTFTYPRGGAIQYVHALAGEVEPESICLGEALLSVDLREKVATTSKRRIRFEYLISSAPLPRLAAACAIDFDASVFRWNRVAVFNLGFDRKGWDGVHWVYFPEREHVFYRVGFYDNIFATDRMSLYVEVGAPAQGGLEIDALRGRVLSDLENVGILAGHRLVSEHHVVLDPAYVHINQKSIEATDEIRALMRTRGIFSLGRYGGWTYCAIEDNIVEARATADLLNRIEPPVPPEV